MLSGLWNSYKQEYWESSTGRTLDKQSNNITTSEGQSYTMLRAVWQSDKATFDATWDWTKGHLQRQDSLFAWKWGQKADGSYGVLTDQGGNNTASDADSDIAFALTMAANRWQDATYLQAAKQIISQIWQQEVISVAGTPYLASNNLEKDSSQDAVMNLSYMAPYTYRIFAKLDTSHNWSAVVDSAYSLMNRALDDKLDTATSVGLPPDWLLLNKQTGAIRAPERSTNLTTNYGYDANRTTWRLALDYAWNKDPRAKTTLQRMSFLSTQWQQTGKLAAIYGHDGTIKSGDEPPEAYGTAIGYFKVVDPHAAATIYQTKLVSLYDADSNTWSQPMSYYSDNWAWFGMALYTDQLDNLTT